VLVRQGPDRFSLTPEGNPLRTGVPDSVRDFVQLCCSPEVWSAWVGLPDTMATGHAAFDVGGGNGTLLAVVLGRAPWSAGRAGHSPEC
jgi:hypothetical protein